MKVPGQPKRDPVRVLVAAAVLRSVMIIWGWSGAAVMPRAGMSEGDFRTGYAIAEGYGYNTLTNHARERMIGFYRAIGAEDLRRAEEAAPRPESDDVAPLMLHPPGLPLLVAGIYRVSGANADRPLEILGLVLDTLAAGLVWWMAAFHFGPRMGLAAGLAYALFPPAAYWSTVAKAADGLLAPFIVTSLACMLRGACRSGRKAAGWYLLAGTSLGLGCYLRPDFLFLPAFLGLALWAMSGRLLRALAAAAIMQVLVLLILLPWAYRNHRLSGRWIFTSTSVGATLLSGLSEFNNDWGFAPQDKDRDEQARVAGLPNAWVPEADAYFRRLFWKSVAEKPGAYAMTVVRRVPMALATPFAWGFANPHKTKTFTESRASGADRYDVIWARPLYVLSAYWDRLAMAALTLVCTLGIGVMLIREWPKRGVVLLLLGPHLYALATHLLTHLEPRYLLPSVFAWLFGLGYLLARPCGIPGTSFLRAARRAGAVN